MGDTNRLVYWGRRLGRIALIGWMGLLLIGDLGMALAQRPVALLPFVCGVAGFVAVLTRARWRMQSLAALLGLSLLSSILIGALGPVGSEQYIGMAEGWAILFLTVGALRWVEPIGRAVLLALGSMIVLVVASGTRSEEVAALAIGLLSLMAWSFAAGTGAYLRFQRDRREQATHAVRRAERLELARELHDLVAHHITGIVVQAQAARTVAEQKPEAVVPALDAIATAGADALTSMRRLVSVLRAQDDASRTPGVALADLRLLVERFNTGGRTKAVFEVGRGVSETVLPQETWTTLHRVLQESLTNVRRHAPHAGWVEIDLRLVQGWLWMRVRNESPPGEARTLRLGGGFGLVGMGERVEALGGRLFAGRAPDGAWEVIAQLPAAAA
ncbi:two-component sensor histidine kinase [Spongiactinospora gelatinilytica]|uniref:histidine kinase n=1 Tax=Spongiactinospora gelatinilytica TaxID=2666298 RepID=A0A2W2G446_9ACTN|nr:histidine kinase [Spongiactinospora gelatinilytica]PZG35165.1 two-component sensor histidine kinase [Spongiactinospora gelatinilytica]